ncbi:AlbA family DNA-binding domain-containing protein [Streptomyces sp. NBC_01477]|uniref:AlbA family DNA-binding domain-containing protein n=1 Tax=Streptomyces sp. NBC_01477 TaxID=2976015 RepID=UPI002E353625|nr:ATP-binding protein [Streptomyces sp. NBC_01477]
MTQLSRMAIVSALAQGRPEDIKGTAENAWLDFKRTPYPVQTDKGKFDLAKDVAAFANAQGGLLVCGISTVALETEAKDVADEMMPFSIDQAKVQTCRDVINRLVQPPANVNLTWYESHTHEGNGYLVIEVEPLREQARYSLVRKFLSDKEKLTEGWCIPIRHGDQTIYLDPNEIYYLINTALQSRTRMGELSAAANPGVDLTSGRQELETLLNWEDNPILFWQTTPPRTPDNFLDQLHRPDGLRENLVNQDALRGEWGFNFVFAYVPPQPHEGGLLFRDSRRALYVRTDGSIIAAATATEDMLCWAMDQRAGKEQLNVVALSEMNLEYYRWVDRFLFPLISGTWKHRVTAVRFSGQQPRRLAPGVNPEFPMIGPQHQASTDLWDQEWTAQGDPEIDAYQALSRIYALFGLAASQNPYSERGRVVTAKLRAATRG